MGREIGSVAYGARHRTIPLTNWCKASRTSGPLRGSDSLPEVLRCANLATFENQGVVIGQEPSVEAYAKPAAELLGPFGPGNAPTSA